MEYLQLAQQKHLFHHKNLIFMLSINVKENESIDKALKRFKKKFEKAGVLRTVRSRNYFEKPSITNRTERIRAAYRQKMQMLDEEL